MLVALHQLKGDYLIYQLNTYIDLYGHFWFQFIIRRTRSQWDHEHNLWCNAKYQCKIICVQSNEMKFISKTEFMDHGQCWLDIFLFSLWLSNAYLRSNEFPSLTFYIFQLIFYRIYFLRAWLINTSAYEYF